AATPGTSPCPSRIPQPEEVSASAAPESLFPLEPDGGVMEDGSAERRTGIGAGQDIDADPFDNAVVRPDALDHHDARLKPVERLRMDKNGAAPVADSDKPPIG